MRGNPKEIAKMQWKNTLKHYSSLNHSGNEQNKMSDLVILIHQDYEESLYPHTSHALLIVKPMHRYDANCDELYVSFQDKRFKIEYILKKSKKADVAFEISDDVSKVYNKIKPLLDKLLQSLDE